MMNIPEYQMKGSLTTNAPAAQADPGEFAQAGKSMTELGKTVESVALKTKESFDHQAYWKGVGIMSKGMNDLKTKMAQDPEIYKNQADYQKQLDQLRSDSAVGIGDPSLRAQFDSNFDEHHQNFIYDMNTAGRKQQFENEYAQGLDALDSMAKSYPTANPKEQNDIKLQIAGFYKSMDAKGVMTPQAAQEARQKRINELTDTSVEQQIADDPHAALEQLKSGYWDAKGLEPHKKPQLEAAARTQMKVMQDSMDYLDAQSQLKNESNIVRTISAGGVTPDLKKSWDNWGRAGQISPEVAGALTKATKNSKVLAGVSETDPTTYLDLRAKQADPQFGQKAFIGEVTKAWGEGKLSRADMAGLTGNDLGLKDDASKPSTVKQNKFQEAVKFIMHWLGNHSDAPKVDGPYLFRQLDAAQKGSDPVLNAHDAVKQLVVQKNPVLSGNKELPNSIMDAEGGFKNVYIGKPTTQPDFSIGHDFVTMTRPDGATRKVPPAKVAAAAKAGWKQVNSGTTAPAK